MGHDITTLSNHNLNTKSLKALALDLFARLNVNIQYGYFGYKEYNSLLDSNYKNEDVIIDTLIKNKEYPTFLLKEENYLQKKVIEKYGNDIVKTPEFLMTNKSEETLNYIKSLNLEEELKEIHTIEYNFEKVIQNENDDYEYLIIYKHIFENSMFYFSRWWNLCRCFTVKDYCEINHPHLLKYRKKLQHYTKILGGNKVYYIDDQSYCLGAVGQGDEAYLTWQELEKHIIKNSDELIDIPKYNLDEKYQKACISDYYDKTNFVDDFRDLK